MGKFLRITKVQRSRLKAYFRDGRATGNV